MGRKPREIDFSGFEPAQPPVDYRNPFEEMVNGIEKYDICPALSNNEKGAALPSSQTTVSQSGMIYEPQEYDPEDTQEMPVAIERSKKLFESLGMEIIKNCPKCGFYLYCDEAQMWLTQCPSCFTDVDDWEIMLTGKSSLVEEVVKELYPPSPKKPYHKPQIRKIEVDPYFERAFTEFIHSSPKERSKEMYGLVRWQADWTPSLTDSVKNDWANFLKTGFPELWAKAVKQFADRLNFGKLDRKFDRFYDDLPF